MLKTHTLTLLFLLSSTSICFGKLRIGVPLLKPYGFYENGEYSGICVDHAKKILGDTPYKIINAPWKRVQHMAKLKKLDAIICMVRTPQREEYMDFTNQIGVTEKLLVTSSHNSSNLKISDSPLPPLVVLRGEGFGKFDDKIKSSKYTVFVNTLESLVGMITENRLKYGILDKFAYQKHKTPLIKVIDRFSKKPYYAGIPKGSKAISIKDLNERIKAAEGSE